MLSRWPRGGGSRRARPEHGVGGGVLGHAAAGRGRGGGEQPHRSRPRAARALVGKVGVRKMRACGLDSRGSLQAEGRGWLLPGPRGQCESGKEGPGRGGWAASGGSPPQGLPGLIDQSASNLGHLGFRRSREGPKVPLGQKHISCAAFLPGRTGPGTVLHQRFLRG